MTPSCVHLSRNSIFEKKTPEFTYENIYEIKAYIKTLDLDEKFTLVIEDAEYENCLAGVVDLAFCASVEYLNIQGIGQPERSAKVDRYQAILEEL